MNNASWVEFPQATIKLAKDLAIFYQRWLEDSKRRCLQDWENPFDIMRVTWSDCWSGDPSLLMAMNPLPPRQKAIWLLPLSHQSFIVVPVDHHGPISMPPCSRDFDRIHWSSGLNVVDHHYRKRLNHYNPQNWSNGDFLWALCHFFHVKAMELNASVRWDTFALLYLKNRSSRPDNFDVTFDDVAEVDHVGDLAPAVLAHPTATAGTVGLDDRTYDVPVIVVRRSDPVVGVLNVYFFSKIYTHVYETDGGRGTYLAVDEVLIPVVAGHDAREAVGPSQHEGHGHLSVTNPIIRWYDDIIEIESFRLVQHTL